MAFTAALPHNFFASISTFSINTRKIQHRLPCLIRAVKSSEPPQNEKTAETSPSNDQSTTKAAPKPKKPVYSMNKGQIVRVDKEKYLNSINYLSVGHPPYYKGLDYIYEDKGEVLDLRIFETGEYALIAWVGIPTAPAWLPTDMLIKVPGFSDCCCFPSTTFISSMFSNHHF
ncbi:NAD(P)H-quinone oxidoreductase subunit O, chloroplastic [Dorcoceras hygrometricum]|uniref:NAD(P)H-quinone oxidoreductase subunit O, chloroplastic n=1 Tax=Dorcoceras hygrometricum TaxID=472368 RepID=A0A2Z7DAS2_9LAMI|nr:NAD(P)H-quinone oxidoreductase subunit O, chloroplastic [Dorcoceras hygrometricum]